MRATGGIGASAATSQQDAQVASAKARSRCTRAGRDRAMAALAGRVALSTGASGSIGRAIRRSISARQDRAARKRDL